MDMSTEVVIDGCRFSRMETASVWYYFRHLAGGGWQLVPDHHWRLMLKIDKAIDDGAPARKPAVSNVVFLFGGKQ